MSRPTGSSPPTASSSSSFSPPARSGSRCCRVSRAPAPHGTFGSVLSSYALALALVAVPAIALGVLANDWTAEQLAGGLPPIAQETAADALVFLVPAAIAHLYAALAASGLAAFDSYGTAAAGYALGSILGLAVILWRVDEDGIVACAWGPLAERGRDALGAADRAGAARRLGTPRRGRHRCPLCRVGARYGAADRASGVLRRLPSLRQRPRDGLGDQASPTRTSSRRRSSL